MNMFLKEKTVALLVSLSNGKKSMYISQIAKETNCMYPHALMVLKNFEKKGYVVSEKSGRKRSYTLTPIGEKLAKGLSKVQEFESVLDEKMREKGDKLKEYTDKIEEFRKQMVEGAGEKERAAKKRVLLKLKRDLERLKVIEKNKEKQDKLMQEIDLLFKRFE